MKSPTARPPHFLASEYPNATAARAAFHIIPVPMELSVSYGAGAARGPAAILESSSQLEAHDRGIRPGAAGIHTQPTVQLPRKADAEAWIAAITASVSRALAVKARPLILGGEHTVTLGAARAFAAARRKIGFVHIDAHADLRDQYEGAPVSHACVMRRVVDLGFPVVQFGTRAYSEDEQAFRRGHPQITAFDADRLTGPTLPRRLLPARFPKRIYVTFDVDGLDPAQMPATGTPVAGGLFWRQAMALLDHVAQGRTIVGGDVVELAPIPGLHHADFTAAQLVHRLLALMTP